MALICLITSRMLIHDIEESIKAEEKERAEKKNEDNAVVLGDKYTKPTSKERRKSLIPVRNNSETVILPIPGTSKSSPPFYKVVKRTSVNDEMKRINNRPRILHIPTIYQENTDEEDNAEFPSPILENDSPPELPLSLISVEELFNKNVEIKEILENEVTIKSANNNSDCCKDKNQTVEEISQSLVHLLEKPFERSEAENTTDALSNIFKTNASLSSAQVCFFCD